MPVRSQEQFEFAEMLDRLSNDFEYGKRSVVEGVSKAMARGRIINKVAVPQFIIATRDNFLGQSFMRVTALGEEGMPEGKYLNCIDYPNSIGFEMSGPRRRVGEPGEPLSPTYASLQGEPSAYRRAVQTARTLLPAACEAHPLLVTGDIAVQLAPHAAKH